MASEPTTQIAIQERKQQSMRQYFEVLRAQLLNERSTFLTHWRDLGDYILPRRPRFQTFDVNRGDRRNLKIIDSTAQLAARTLRSGMMGGITSPARPWFRLTTSDPELAEMDDVKEWLHIVTQNMTEIFLRSNLYNALPLVYGDMGVFGTACMSVEEDIDDVVRFYVFPIGSYAISCNEKGQVDTFIREFRMTVRQVLAKFGKKDANGEWDWSNFSEYVKNQYLQSQDEAWIEVRHVICLNDKYDPNKIESKFKRYRSVYYEAGYGIGTGASYVIDINSDVFLRDRGYDRFPMLVPRWEANAEDVYGNECPGIDALGDIKALQTMHKRKAQGIEKKVNPPMTGPTALRTQKTSILPGDITYNDVSQGQQGFRPVHEVNISVKEILEDIFQHQGRVKECFFADLFRMLIDDPRTQPPTAEEIREKAGEKLLAIGPVLEQLNQDLLDPLIDITFDMMMRQRLIPVPPKALQGKPLKIEYVSIMAQAQKLVGISALERFAGFVGNVAKETGDMSVLDKVNLDELVTQYGDAVSIPPKIVRSDDDVQQIRNARAKQAQANAAAERLKALAGAGKDLSQTDTGGDNALTSILAQAKAGEPVPQS